LNSGLQHALEAGRLLLEAKNQVDHGRWLPWLEANFDGSQRTARAYMLVAQRWPHLKEQNGNAVANLSYRQAVRLLTVRQDTPKDKAPLSDESPFSFDEMLNFAESWAEDLLRRRDAHWEHFLRVHKRRLDACTTVDEILALQARLETKSVMRRRQRLERETEFFQRWAKKVAKAIRKRASELQAAEVLQ